jgi:hypothetical protein
MAPRMRAALPGTERLPMRLFGTVTFTERGKTYAWSSREEPPSTVEHPHEVRSDGVVIRTRQGVELVAWECVDELRGWSPVAPEDR